MQIYLWKNLSGKLTCWGGKAYNFDAVRELRVTGVFFMVYVCTQYLAFWFSCQENLWILEISYQDLSNYPCQDMPDFARVFKNVERNPIKVPALGKRTKKSR